MADYLESVLPKTAAGEARKAAEAKRAVAAQAAQAPAPELQPQAEQSPAAGFAGPPLIQDEATGQHLIEDTDGKIWMHRVGGGLEKVDPNTAGTALRDPMSPYYAASGDDVKKHLGEQEWDNASLAAKSDYVARRTLTTIADGVTAPVRIGAKLFGASPELDQKLSGENVVRQLDSFLAGEQTAAAEAGGQRSLEKVAPQALNTAIDVGGLVLGGAAGGRVAGLLGKAGGLLGAAGEATSLEGLGAAAGRTTAKLAESMGVSAEKAAKLGAYADTVAQGAAIGNTQAAHEAWIKDEKLTSEAQWQAIGLGAILGVGGHAAIDALRGLPRAGLSAAEKVFGKPRASVAGEAASAEAAGSLVDDISGVKQPEGVGSKVQQLLDYTNSKLESLQAEHIGAKVEDVRAFHKAAPEIEHLAANRDAIFDQGRKDLQGALEQLHANGGQLAEQVTDVAMKREHMARLLASSDAAPIMQTAKAKAAEFADALEAVKSQPDLLGGKKATRDIRAAYETVINSLADASEPADVTSALDVFKRSTQRAKVLSERTATRVASEVDQQQAQYRAQFMHEVSENTRNLLQDSGLFGDFGKAQTEVNSRFNRMLDSDKYVKQQLFERTGEISSGPRFGAPRYELSPGKIESYLNGLGTARAETIDRLLRDNISARRELAESLSQHYELSGSHASELAGVRAGAEKAQGVLSKLDNSVRILNLGDDLTAKGVAAAGHGHEGIATAVMVGHMVGGPLGAAAVAAVKAANIVLNPVKFSRSMLALRAGTEKLTGVISRSVNRALGAAPSAEGVGAVARVIASKETQEQYHKRYVSTAAKVATLAADPSAAIEAVSDAAQHIEHPGVQQGLVTTSMNALGFLASKLPPPLYQNATGSQRDFNNVSDSSRDAFMRYATAVNSPLDFFRDLGSGTATPEQAETASTLMPEAFAHAQQETILKFASGHVNANYQVRLNVQRMLQVQIEPIASPALQQFLAAQAQQAAQQSHASGGAGAAVSKPAGASSAASNLQSPLSKLRI